MILSTFETLEKEQPMDSNESMKVFDFKGSKCHYKNETEVVEQTRKSNF